ncbi:hypothetical protein CC80DRAFT_549922 [Byssothecium circinans]|uniref:Uncharacterized protein n=1 Tax=Byssothecium circinans TaxID=147558 RepID=A0A6A5TPB1_9PLEO|nr:hypothetical protein CC80DRAFT_549922 [Byssothecium circinans]
MPQNIPTTNLAPKESLEKPPTPPSPPPPSRLNEPQAGGWGRKFIEADEARLRNQNMEARIAPVTRPRERYEGSTRVKNTRLHAPELELSRDRRAAVSEMGGGGDVVVERGMEGSGDSGRGVGDDGGDGGDGEDENGCGVDGEEGGNGEVRDAGQCDEGEKENDRDGKSQRDGNED